jgi:photosystem II stability/assembly factor-like uncharacterized protein
MSSSTILYVAGGKGVFTLMKNGGDWRVENHSLADWTVPKVTVSPLKPNRIIAGTRGDGVWVSEDFGKQWIKPSYGKPGPGKVRCVTLHPIDVDTLYAGTEPIELFVSRDCGKNWMKMDSVRQVPSISSFTYPVAGVEPHMRDLLFRPKDPATLYAALQVGYMIKSTDGGATWKLLDQGLDADVHSICIDPQQPQRMYIATGGDFYRQGKSPGRALYMSEDSGESWSPFAMNFEEDYAVPLVMHPEKADIIYSALAKGSPGHWRRPTGAECLVIRTEDGGKSWQKLGSEVTDGGKKFVEVLVIDKTNPDHIYAAVRTGEIYASQDGGDSWAKLNVKVDSVSDMACVHA